MTQISRSGVSVEVPPGWEAEMTDYSRRIVLHMSNAPLPAGRSDFGGRAIDLLRDNAIFLAVLEYDQAESSRGLYQRAGRPAFVPADFAPNRLHHSVPGKTGAQKFFTLAGRTFCCYAVIGKETASMSDVAKVNDALRRLSLSQVRLR